MKKNGFKEKRSFYSSIFLALTLTIVATILILSAILYFSFENIVTGQIYDYTRNNLRQKSEGALQMKNNTSTLLKQIFIDTHIASLRNHLDIDPIDIRNGLTQLNYYRNTSPYIDSIYIYNRRSGLIYISSEHGENQVVRQEDFYDEGIMDILAKRESYRNLMPIPRRIEAVYPTPSEFNVYSFLLSDTISASPTESVIVVNYLETYLMTGSGSTDEAGTGVRNEAFKEAEWEDETGATFIIDSTGMLVTDGSAYPRLSDVSQVAYIKRILIDPGSGYFIDQVEGVKSFVAYMAPDALGWRYIRVVPYEEITSSITRLRGFTVLFSMIILGIGLTLSYLLSRRLSDTVDKRLSKLRLLEMESRTHLRRSQEEYLKKLLLSEERQEQEAVAESFSSLGIPMDPAGLFTLLILRIDRYEAFMKKYEGSDRSLFKFAIMNVAQEILSNCGQVMAVDMNEDRIVLFVNQEAGQTDAMQELPLSLLKGVQDSVLKYLEISVTLTVSEKQKTAQNLGRLYSRALKASFYRMFTRSCSIIRAADYLALEARSYTYPEKKEKLILNALLQGKDQEAMSLVEEILEEIVEYPFAAFNIALAHLSYAIGSAAVLIAGKEGTGLGEDFYMNGMFASLSRAETLEDIYDDFREKFGSLSALLEEKKSTRQDEPARKTMEIIENKYMNQTLSLESIADELGLSSAYLGRVFKRYTSKTILDYIVEVRMGKARQLLLETGLSVGEIAERTGFSNSPYFFKAFKKTHGMTPAEFRKSGKILQMS